MCSLCVDERDLGLAGLIDGGPLRTGFAELNDDQVPLQLTILAAGQFRQDRIFGHLVPLSGRQLLDAVAGQSENRDHAPFGLDPAQGTDLGFCDGKSRLSR